MVFNYGEPFLEASRLVLKTVKSGESTNLQLLKPLLISNLNLTCSSNDFFIYAFLPESKVFFSTQLFLLLEVLHSIISDFF